MPPGGVHYKKVHVTQTQIEPQIPESLDSKQRWQSQTYHATACIAADLANRAGSGSTFFRNWLFLGTLALYTIRLILGGTITVLVAFCVGRVTSLLCTKATWGSALKNKCKPYQLQIAG